jgi:cell division protease FtsH
MLNNLRLRWIRLFIIIGSIGLLLWAYNSIRKSFITPEISFSDFVDHVKNKRIKNVTISENRIIGEMLSGDKFKTYSSSQYEGLINLLIEKGIRVKIIDANSGFKIFFWFLGLSIICLILLGIISAQKSGVRENTMNFFAKSKAKMQSKKQKKITFKDVAGVDEAKYELMEIVEFLKRPQKFQKLGGHIPKGVLLVGPPGTGKTLLAKAVAGEADVPFFSISGSDFVEIYVGVGASRVRDLFEKGKKNAPCIIFIDEIDAVGRHRGAGLGGGHDEREQTLNQLLVEMDGFEDNVGTIIIASTNRPDILDPALLRPGRFDRRIVINNPDIRGREAILAVHTRNIPLAKDVDIKILARSTPGFSGADLANLVNEAALNAARSNQKEVRMIDFEFAKDKVLMGPERRSLLISEEDKKITAIHEAGHALAAILLPFADPIHKVTIIPRGIALGTTQQLPLDDKHNYSKEYLMDQIAVLLGGRAAEEIMNNKITTGASNDLERCTKLARQMVCKWGMSENMGPLTFGIQEKNIFLGKELIQHKDYSENTAQQIDNEVKQIVINNYERVKKLLEANKDKLIILINELLINETLESNQIKEILMLD